MQEAMVTTYSTKVLGFSLPLIMRNDKGKKCGTRLLKCIYYFVQKPLLVMTASRRLLYGETSCHAAALQIDYISVIKMHFGTNLPAGRFGGRTAHAPAILEDGGAREKTDGTTAGSKAVVLSASTMDNRETEGEDHPLKNNEGKTIENNDASGEKDACIKKQSGLSRLSKIRTASFFGALFLCLAVVFAFSFIIPCPVRPISQRTWSIQYDKAVGYPFLATQDVNQDKVQDVIFIFKTDNASKSNVSCVDEGFQQPCFFLSALSGTNGSTLWVRPVSDDDVLLVECGIHYLGGVDDVACLVIRKSGFILAIDSTTGHPLWEKPTRFAPESTVIKPLLKIPDVDNDGVEDLMVFIFVENELQSATFSGKSGNGIGQKWRIGTDQPSGYYTHVTNSKAQYVLFYKVIKMHFGTNLPAGRFGGRTAHAPAILEDGGAQGEDGRDPGWI
ncbi:unnamed protein product, partial [Ranitomeya imitator]